MRYAAEEFERIGAKVVTKGSYIYAEDLEVVSAALRIAARAVTPGVIEDAAMAALQVRGSGKEELATAIREALTNPKEGTT